MKFNKYVCLLGLLAVLLLPTSCKESFLEQKNTQGITEDALFKKESDGVALVTGIYDTFHDVDFTLKALWYQANFLSQDFKNYGADTFFETYEVKSDFAALDLFWTRAYQGIARANSAIPIIANMKTNKIMSDTLANRLTGETLFLRGLFYYYLASNFGGVPLELKTVTDDGRHPRNTQDEVFTAVAADMKAAAELLPWPQDLTAVNVGRATKGAALAYLGDAQMWLKQYAAAAATYEQLTNRYQLEKDFINIHEFNNQNGKESVFEIQYIAGQDMSWGHTNDSHWLTTFGIPEEISQFGYCYADKKLYDSFEPGDTRKLATVIGPGDTHPSPAIQIKNYPLVKEKWGGINTLGTKEKPWKGSDNLRSGYYGVKTWRDPNATGNSGNPAYIFSGQNLILMRYGQVLLSKAEALAKSGNTAGALDVINSQIRKRAGLGAASGTNVTSILLNEYRHELAGEFSLWFILRRSGEHLNYVKEKYGITVPPGKDLMPIPEKQIATNQKLEQNPGYK
ncbi:RagB/SusD family nutrient uptake outer membrane protein [Spirosoma soli]|uniref:RagB/SusD family nutrient uptake outer membrane protein n=1 Tax=Spirosoma soli TaxID=1770529 RepID=A0ABW5M079_9BACT